MKKETDSKTEKALAGRQKEFVQKLLNWNRYYNNREMPWKGEKDPYKIWLSEVILQQTRVEQGLKYYQNFIAAFPSITALAKAPDEKVFKLWEGLGYYSRCRNLLQTARYISEDLNGVFPTEYKAILDLKGVGSYTAAAIGSFAYNLPYAVLDGNVFRVLSRIFDIEQPIDSTEGKKTFAALAQSILPQKKAGEYNQAIMDFGAVICKPLPLCHDCFFNKKCLAYLAGKQDLLPVKQKKIKVKKRWLNYFIIQCGDEFLIQQRTEKDIWQNLFQFLVIETEKETSSKKLQALLNKQFNTGEYSVTRQWTEEQKLSHQTIHFRFISIQLKEKKLFTNYQWVKLTQLQHLAFPKTLQQAVQKLVA